MAVVTIDTDRGAMPAELAEPTDVGPVPGVLVIHDALGMTTDLRRQAQWLAGAGFLALAPDLFHWGGRIRCVAAAMAAASRGHGRTFDDLARARDWLAARDDCTGEVGVIGFCMGGGFALLLSTLPDYTVASVNYGALFGDPDHLARACPIVASFGGRDRSMNDTPQQLESLLSAHGIPHDIKTYPDAGHGFLNDHPRDEVPVWARVAGRWANTDFNEPAAIDARRRIEDFFHEHTAPKRDRS